MNIVITSPRAPIVLEWIKIAQRGLHDILLTDSIRYPVARFNPHHTRFCHIPAPRQDFDAYRHAMLKLIDWADMVIPTCEDIFYLSKLPLTNAQRAKCFMPNHELLFTLHHKFNFFDKLPDTEGIGKPKTALITDKSQLIFDTTNHKTILKPVYSRFGRHVVRGVNQNSTANLSISQDYPWVQQTFIHGNPLCNYAICEHGKVIAHAVYQPCYLLNQSASTYFRPIDDERAEKFIHAFAKQNHYHGQVAFDFIDDGKCLYILECNPRATSGLHLIGNHLTLDKDGKLHHDNRPFDETSLRVSVTLPLLFGLPALKQGKLKELWQDYKQATDVIKDIPPYAHALSLGEMCFRSVRYGRPLTSASTFDIEYDGISDDK